MASSVLMLGLALLSLFCSHTYAADPGPLQDFCVAINKNSPVFVNGFTCKDPNQVVADDFFFTGLNVSGDTRNGVRSKITFVTVNELPGLNTLGIAMVRIDYAPFGVNPPHLHPRASEILTVLEGTVLAGFVTSNPDHRLMSKILHAGDVFAFPHGLIHFQQNIGKGNAVAHASFNSQNPGVITIANATFGSKPPISDDILARAFQVEKEIIDLLKTQYQAQFWGCVQ